MYCIGFECCDINVYLIDCNIEVLLLFPCVEVVLSSLFRRNSVARYVKHTEFTASNIILCLIRYWLLISIWYRITIVWFQLCTVPLSAPIIHNKAILINYSCMYHSKTLQLHFHRLSLTSYIHVYWLSFCKRIPHNVVVKKFTDIFQQLGLHQLYPCINNSIGGK